MAVLLQVVILILGLRIVRIWVRTSWMNLTIYWNLCDSHEILISRNLVDPDLVDYVIDLPVQVDAVLPMPESLNVERAHLGIRLVISCQPFFCLFFWGFFGSFFKLAHLLVEGVEPVVHLAVRVKVQPRHELNLRRFHP